MKSAKWIWQNGQASADEYVQFYDTFSCNGGKTVIRISCDTNYVLYINGKMAAYGQYAAYPDIRVYDTVDLSDYITEGKNTFAAVVWYWGLPAMVYTVGEAGLAYEIECDGELVAFSSEKTLCRIADDYEQGHGKYINWQQGLTYFYNPNGKDGFSEKDYVPKGFTNATVREHSHTFFPRPNKKTELMPTLEARLIDPVKKIYDLGSECAGILHIRYRAEKNAEFRICFGEYIAEDGNLLRFFDAHDYTLNYTGTGRTEEHIAYMRRIGCRYLQVLGDAEIELLGLKEVLYPLTEKPVIAEDPAVKKIYDVSVRTLRLCMHEHYEDCPWREQVLYNMDSRNAMLYTYEVFGDFEFARSNLWLMSLAPDKDGFYPASFPSGEGRWSVIPVFNLIYVIQCEEYLAYSADRETVSALYPRLEAILGNFASRKNGGLLRETEGCWNFVEWTDNMTGHEERAGQRTPLALNCFYLLALASMDRINRAIGKTEVYGDEIRALRESIRRAFFDTEGRVFFSYAEEKHVCSLGNALAVIAGCAVDEKSAILEKIAKGELQETSLAMRCFVYDALLTEDKKYHEFILRDIMKDYGYMLEHDATSFWETINGEKEYGGAGSLCHVWSAMPIVYLKRIGAVRDVR